MATSLPQSIRWIRQAIHMERGQEAYRKVAAAIEACRERGDEEKAGVLVGVAAFEKQRGNLDEAMRLASESLDLVPTQWASRRLLISCCFMRNELETAQTMLADLEPMSAPAAWDEPLQPLHLHLANASLAWRLGEWDAAAYHLQQAYPDGVDSMTPALQEDWLRLALYRAKPQDAAGALVSLIRNQTAAGTDILLQSIVQQGWMDEALPLYRTAFTREPESQLLRRRLVALCIRTGALDEARRLTQFGPLALTS